jgi:anaerobic magnesium-protoporphyrin IX monomethyl ester cyclase
MAKVILTGGPSFSLFNPSLHASLGILYLASAVREAGHSVKIVDCHKLSTFDAEANKLRVDPDLLEPCDILGVSIVTPNAEFGGQLAALWPAKVKVAGGPHVTYIIEGPHAQFKQKKYFEGFDFLMTGECEESFVQFCNAFDAGSDLTKIPGITWFNPFGMQHLPSPPLPDVTKMKLPAYDLWQNYSTGGLQIASIHGKSIDVAERTIGSLWTARGCPYGCSFCADARTKLREETFAQIEAEVKALAELGVTALRVWDDVLTIKAKRCRELASLFHDYGMLWRGWSRVNLFDPELFRDLARLGCTELGFGVEHGSARMLKAMNKGTTPEANERGVKTCRDAGIATRAYLLVGFPGETWESIYEMRDWLEKARPDAASLHTFQPFPGCEVWNAPEKFGVTITSSNFSDMWELDPENPDTCTLDIPTMTRAELHEARKFLHEWITDNISLRPVNR